jgi:hypothetical protein
MASQQDLARGRQVLASRTQGGIYNGGGSAYSPGKNDSLYSLLLGGGLAPGVGNAFGFHSGPQLPGVNNVAQHAMRQSFQNPQQPGNVLGRSGSVGGPGAGKGAGLGGMGDPGMLQQMQQGLMGNQVGEDMMERQNKLQQELQRSLLRDKIEMITKFFNGGGMGGGQTMESNTYGDEYHNVGGRPVRMPTRQRQVQTTSGFDPNELIKMLLG